MYTCEGLQMGQSNGVLFKEVAAFRRCHLIEVSPYAVFKSMWYPFGETTLRDP